MPTRRFKIDSHPLSDVAHYVAAQTGRDILHCTHYDFTYFKTEIVIGFPEFHNKDHDILEMPINIEGDHIEISFFSTNGAIIADPVIFNPISFVKTMQALKSNFIAFQTSHSTW